jgi:hypothetical protein
VAKLATQDAAAAAMRDVTKPFMENADLERIWRIGLEDLSALSVEERTRFFHAAYQFLKAFETIHFHFVYGTHGSAAMGRVARTPPALRRRSRHRVLLEASS